MNIERKSIVVAYRPGRQIMWVGMGLLTFVLALLVGRYWGGYESTAIIAEKVRLEENLLDVKEDLKLRKEQLSSILLSSEVDTVALENTRQQMVILQRQIYARDEDLKLYRDLLQDTDSPSGLSVGDFSLTQLDDGRIKYRWVARQKAPKMKLLSVFADIRVLGMSKGDKITLGLSEVDEQVEKMPLKLEFKYFFIGQGIMQLPDSFDPASVKISLRYTWDKEIAITQDFVWEYED